MLSVIRKLDHTTTLLQVDAEVSIVQQGTHKPDHVSIFYNWTLKCVTRGNRNLQVDVGMWVRRISHPFNATFSHKQNYMIRNQQQNSSHHYSTQIK
jgi:hypothetical protein